MHLARGQVDEIFTRTLLEDILPTAAPEFAQTTEDGLTECTECSMPSSRLQAAALLSRSLTIRRPARCAGSVR